MKVRELRQRLCFSGGEDISQLDTLLSAIDEADIAHLVAAMKPVVAKLQAGINKQRLFNQQSEAAIDGFVRELQGAKNDNSSFEAIVERMKKSKAIKIGEATAIASKFLGEPKSFKSKPEAAKAILKRQIGDRRAAERKTGASDIL